MSSNRIRLLSLMRPAMGIIPEVAPPERKVLKFLTKLTFFRFSCEKKSFGQESLYLFI